MQQAADATRGAMVSIIGGDEAAVNALCSEAADGDALVPANFNCPGQIVISGAVGACERAVALAGNHGVRAIMLKVAGAFHSPLMAAAADELRQVLNDTPFAETRCPVIANVSAVAHGQPADMRDALRLQVTEAVRWQQSIENLIEQGFDRFIEVGPGRVLTGLMRKIDRSVKAVNVSSHEAIDLDAILPTNA